ncbi:hypothetical protein [Bordetella genomosp. 11]|uniref:Uncharacterized protein n=1 Tax=Bordetella genomosp. 11 TaxID=1416808 RepID=A0A261UIL4_9BORD|nr:hypothetical protein [Bordetella genomosp. 11]OZI61377.1 hypothetical protein CAL28_18895 [Bordetella genomosp. 11]
MSDAVLQAHALRSGNRPSRRWPWFRRLRLKGLGGELRDFVAEVFAAMERGRDVRPIVSAYAPPRS